MVRRLKKRLPILSGTASPVQVPIVQGRQVINVLGDEVGDVEVGVNEERITQDDFAGAGGAVDSDCLVARHDVSLDVPETEGTCAIALVTEIAYRARQRP